MRRKSHEKLGLHRETLRHLDRASLRRAAGGTDISLCVSDLPGMCNPSNDSACESRCLACPERPPTIEN